MENTNRIEIDFSSLLTEQERMGDSAEGAGPEVTLMVDIFKSELRELGVETAALLEELAERIRKSTTWILHTLDKKSEDKGVTADAVCAVIERLEREAMPHFTSLSTFSHHMAQISALLARNQLRLPEDHQSLYKVICGTTAVKNSIRDAKKFIEVDLLQIKKELV